MAMDLSYKRGDLEPSWRTQCVNADGTVPDLTSALSAKVIAKRVTGTTTISRSMSFYDRANGWVEWDPTATDTDVVGTYDLEVQITWTVGRWETFPDTTFATLTIYQDLGD